MKKKKISLVILLLGILSICVNAADNGNGTYTNPVIWADLPDPDVIRVGDTFYMVSTTMHLMPGGPVMKSKDLVNWEMSSYLFDSITDNSRYYMEEGTVYSLGQWATALQYHDGKFYAYFSPNDAPYRGFVYTTDDPDKGWTFQNRLPHYHDCALFFDTDGRVYTISGSGEIWLNELEADLSDEKADGVHMALNLRDAEENALHEGSRMVKIGDTYYLFIISWPSDKPRRQLCYRSKNIQGPYEKHVILEDNYKGFPYVAQGTIVDDTDGNWWAFIFQDRNAIGRVPTLSPIVWVDGWPMVGSPEGKVPEVAQKPADGQPVASVVHSDDFDGEAFDRLWEWNHNPDNSLWSMSDRPGWLRLRTGKPVESIYHARNTLSQRMEGPVCTGEIKLDVSHMADGDVAGLGAFNGHSGLISICKDNNGYLLKYSHEMVSFGEKRTIQEVDSKELAEVRLPADTRDVYLRVTGDFNLGKDLASFFYSLDGYDWVALQEPFQMRFDYTRLFMGTRLALYNYCTKAPGGWVDVDYFHYARQDQEPLLSLE
ncbi:MAG: glycoside hydrolase 43 family protein [Bacteroidales bacterium]|nr:glycoside hydrolase 43 family protein [Bacteroidales bacterium]